MLHGPVMAAVRLKLNVRFAPTAAVPPKQRLSKQARPFCTPQFAAARRQRNPGGMPTLIEVKSSRGPRLNSCGNVEVNETSYPRLRQSAQQHPIALLHSIIYDYSTALICSHNLSGLTDKSRRYIRPNFSILNSQKKVMLTKHRQFRYLSESIDCMARRARNQD